MALQSSARCNVQPTAFETQKSSGFSTRYAPNVEELRENVVKLRAYEREKSPYKAG